MISRKWKEIRDRRKDNKGAAIVLVIIAIAFIGMLVGMILYMAYCNYLMKANDTLSKDNFYSAEYALDIINAGLQKDISECMSEAYVSAMNNSLNKTADDTEIYFRKQFIQKVQKKFQNASSSSLTGLKWDTDYIKGYWTTGGMTVSAVRGNEGAYLGIKGGSGNNDIVVASSEDYVTLKNFQVVFTDQRGYVSVIETDIRIIVPEIGFAQASSKLTLENFSLIANDSLVNDNTTKAASDGTVANGSSNLGISGSVFGGYDGVLVSSQKNIDFVKDPTDAANGVTKDYLLIADSLSVSNALSAGAGLSIDPSYDTYMESINVETARVDLDGDMYVGNDLNIAGKDCEVTLSGKYTGYGNTFGDADNSSAILINGGNTMLDFRDLQELMLSGHAYVGASKYDADVDRLAFGDDLTEAEKNALDSDKISDKEKYDEKFETDGSSFTENPDTTIPKNERDLLMGESISVKANQLLYMVPAECVGYNVRTGEQVLAKNPLTYDEYKLLTETVEVKKDESGQPVKEDGVEVTEPVYEPVRLAKLWDKLGGVAYTNDYKAVYRRVNGSVLVYLYLDFGVNEVMANEFFKAYYEYDKDGIDSYVNSYIGTLRWNPSLGNNLTLAGNAFSMNSAGDISFVENHMLDTNKYGNMILKQKEYSQNYVAAMHTLSTDYASMTGTQYASEIFDSLVDSAKLQEMKNMVFKNSDNSILAYVDDDDVIYPSTSCPENKTRIIVTSGDIYIKKNYKGLAIAGGNIYICDGCSAINYSPSEVIQAMRTEATDAAGNTLYFYEVFGNNGLLSYGVMGSETENNIELNDLIAYENWKKE